MAQVEAYSSGNGRFVKKAGDSMTSTLTIQSSTDVTELIVKGKAAQTADLQQWKNSSDTVLSYIDTLGYINAPRFYVNPTAYLSGATAGVISATGKLDVNGTNGYLRLGATTDGAEFNLSSSTSGTLAIFGSSAATLNMALLDGRLGILTAAPTHSLTLGSTATGMALYNTSDQTTNYERVRQYWSGNVYYINGEIGGTGTARSIIISSLGTTTQALALNISSISGFVESRGASSTAGAIIHRVNGSLSSTSGVQYGLAIQPTFTQSSTAGYTALLINSTESTTGSGAKNLIDAQVGGVSKFKVSNTGAITTTAYERHIQLPAKVDGSVANQPTPIDFGTVGGLQFATTGAKYAYAQFEVPDDWDGTNMYFEVDWFPDSGATSGTDTVEWVINYRCIAEGESILNGTVKTLTVTDSADYAQYVTKHARFTLPFNDANQPITKQDHVYIQITRNTAVANNFGGSVTVAGYEVIYNSVSLPTSN